MHRILYRSVASDDFRSDDLFKVIEVSARNNPERDVTGFLLYKAGRFLQFIEGPQENLGQLLSQLAKDPRHRDVEVLVDTPASRRCFPRWRMQRIGSDDQAIAGLTDAMRAAGLDEKFAAEIRRCLQA